MRWIAAVFWFTAFSAVAAGNDPGPRKTRHLKIPAALTVESARFSLRVPKGWSFLELEWDPAKRPGSQRASVEILLSPHEGIVEGGDQGGSLLGISLSDEPPSPRAASAPRPREHTETWNGLTWKISEWAEGRPGTPFALSFLEASAAKGTLRVDFTAAGSGAELKLYRAEVNAVLSSIQPRP